MLLPHAHLHGSSQRQLRAAAIMVAITMIEAVIGYPARNPLLLGDALHNLADAGHLAFGALTDYIAHRSTRHRLTCTMPLAVGMAGFIIPAVAITFVAAFETSNLKQLDTWQLSWSASLAIVGVLANFWAHRQLSDDAQIIEASNRLHLRLDMCVSAGIVVAAVSLMIVNSAAPGQVLLALSAALLVVGAVIEIREQRVETRLNCHHQLA